ncbi:MAG: SpoIIE family protein phosphatase [Bryobacteraceae bacterium]|jgi:serine phosphatase RsbU (regulator of sigma subunit)
MEPPEALPAAGAASLEVIDPNGHRARVAIEPLPFHIGRSPENHLILRDSRVSRAHARIVVDAGEYVIEDSGSLHGTFLNGQRVARRALADNDRIDFGAADSYALVFSLNAAQLQRLLDQASAPVSIQTPQGAGGLAKLRAILELARAMQSSLSTDDVLASLVDAALAVTGAERGFLLLRSGDVLETRVARRRDGRQLQASELRVPREVLRHALEHRRDLLYMNFDPLAAGQTAASGSVADLELRSAICVPLVRIRAGQGDATSVLSAASETIGALYMDSRTAGAGPAGGDRELIQTLAIEASTALENARLLEEERAKLRMEEELDLARGIQQSLLPPTLPSEGWLRASGSSVASRMVGGDYFDVTEVNPHCWSAVVADVSGKGVGSALLASLLQGALLTATEHPATLGRRMERLNRFLLGRTAGEKYATVFYSLLDRDGRLSYVNAAQCPPLVVRAGAIESSLEATGPPVGLLETAEWAVAEARLAAGDKLVCYTDGVTEARNEAGEFFGRKRLKQVVAAHAAEPSEAIRQAIQEAVEAFTAGAPQWDDITVLVLEYQG